MRDGSRKRSPRASTGPPRERGGEAWPRAAMTRCRVLQRGRRANAAESVQSTAGPHCAAPLQRGRRANAAERWADASHAGQRQLQRGRRANAAESVRTTDQPSATLQRGRRANAAESRRWTPRVERASTGPPRERGGEYGITACLRMVLQRGRRANAAESGCSMHAPSASCARLQRGRRANAAESISLSGRAAWSGSVLQRGRRANAAERLPMRACDFAVARRFNGAAARTRRRGLSTAPGDLVIGLRASTGPPRERGGELDSGSSTCRGRTRFNGAAARTRRRALEEPLHPGVGHASTGPPRERGGEHVERHVAARDGASTGPPRERGGEVRQAIRRGSAGTIASTGPPRERGGEPARRRRRCGRTGASTGPPRERGGEFASVGQSRSSAPACFNGAAARTRRRGSQRQHAERRESRFNGAAARTRRREQSTPRPRIGASTGPPRERGGEGEALHHAHPTRDVLQRGRRANAAESHPGDVVAFGRRFNGAAARTRRRALAAQEAPESARLQRGRRANAAESGAEALRHAARSSFNGAAARTRRRARWTQTGNDVRDPDASTGPPRERGGETIAEPRRCHR